MLPTILLSKCRAISIHQVWLTTFPKRLTMMLLPTTSKAWRSWNRDYHFEQKRRGYSSRKLAQAFCLHLVSGTQTLNKEKPLKNKRREEAGRRHFAAPLTADVRAYSTRRTLVGGGGTAAATPTLLLHSGSKQLKSAKIIYLLDVILWIFPSESIAISF